MKNCYEIADNLQPVVSNPIGKSYTFVSYETLDNIFPSVEIGLGISDKDITVREVSYHERLESSLNSKLEQHSDIWKELANL